MNRRDFLKTLGLVLSALVLPKAKKENPHNCPHCSGAMEDSGSSYFVEGRRWLYCQSCRHSYSYDYGVLTGRGMDGQGTPVIITDDMQAMAQDAAQVNDEQGLVAQWAKGAT